jgi:hypothetical protein
MPGTPESIGAVAVELWWCRHGHPNFPTLNTTNFVVSLEPPAPHPSPHPPRPHHHQVLRLRNHAHLVDRDEYIYGRLFVSLQRMMRRRDRPAKTPTFANSTSPRSTTVAQSTLILAEKDNKSIEILCDMFSGVRRASLLSSGR